MPKKAIFAVFSQFLLGLRLLTKLIIKTGNIYFGDCVPDPQLGVDKKYVALRCFSNAQQRLNRVPFFVLSVYTVYIIIIFQLSCSDVSSD